MEKQKINIEYFFLKEYRNSLLLHSENCLVSQTSFEKHYFWKLNPVTFSVQNRHFSLFFLDKKAIWFSHFSEKVFNNNNNNNAWFYVHLGIKEAYLADMQSISPSLYSLTYRNPCLWPCAPSWNGHLIIKSHSLHWWSESLLSQRAHLWLLPFYYTINSLNHYTDDVTFSKVSCGMSTLIWIKNELLKWTSQNPCLPHHIAVSKHQR